MANHPSAEKRARQRERRREQNRRHLSRMRTFIKNARSAIEQKADGTREALRQAVRMIDKAAQKGVIKRETAARKISRLTKAFNRAQG